MRIWDIHPSNLCRKHLLGEHRELHGLWNILVQGKKGYSKHPETLRWVGKLGALRLRHDALVEEMTKRGYNHKSPLGRLPPDQFIVQDCLINTIEHQIQILKEKDCLCFR